MLIRLTEEQRQTFLASFLVLKKLHPDCKVAQLAADNGVQLLRELKLLGEENDRIVGQFEPMQKKLVLLKKQVRELREPSPRNLLIWWLNQQNTKAVMDHVDFATLPKYLRSEVKSREGRAGRGRLWIHKTFPPVSVDPWPDTPLAKELADSGGIVFDGEDLLQVHLLPGIVTDLKLEPIEKKGT